jgi:hypothetical protein
VFEEEIKENLNQGQKDRMKIILDEIDKGSNMSYYSYYSSDGLSNKKED